VTINVVIFLLAAFFEIAGCFAFWMSLRRGATPLIAVLGVVSLIAFAFALTRVDSAFAGRAYAAYGGIYIAASLVWLWLIEGQAPTRTDLLGAGLAMRPTRSGSKPGLITRVRRSAARFSCAASSPPSVSARRTSSTVYDPGSACGVQKFDFRRIARAC
jgi:small multidrug resistance family-3 protein